MSGARAGGSGAVVVTGGAGGIGLACARALGARGRVVLLVDVREEPLLAAVAELGAEGVSALAIAGDLCDAETCAALAEEVAGHGGLAALAHTAGLSPTLAKAKRIWDVNLVATAQLVDALRPQANEGACAVLFASQAAHFAAAACKPEVDALLDAPLQPELYEKLVEAAGPLADQPGGAYAISKRGVQRLVVREAPAWGGRGARIVSISPGIIDTEMGRSERAGHSDATQQIIDKTPAGARLGTPQEIAAVVAFLCSDGASFVTGVDWLVDGGSTLQVMSGR